MKGFTFALLCVVATVSARSTGVQTSSVSLGASGQSPWLVHLRVATSNSGLLNSCAGVLINPLWVLTTAKCLENSRFVWIRYGAENVVNPSLVTESSAVRYHPDGDIALLAINRYVHTTDNIAPVTLSSSVDVPESANFCAYGAREDGAAGEVLRCSEVSLETKEDGTIVAHGETDTTRFDIGAPLVSEGALVGLLTTPASEDNAGVFINPADFKDWIEENTDVEFSA